MPPSAFAVVVAAVALTNLNIVCHTLEDMAAVAMATTFLCGRVITHPRGRPLIKMILFAAQQIFKGLPFLSRSCSRKKRHFLDGDRE